MICALLIAVLTQVPHILVIDLDGGEPRHLVVILDGEPFKITSIPGGVGPGPSPGPAPGPSPGPTPPPGPSPDPSPTPISSILWVTYIVPELPTIDDAAPMSYAPLRARIDGQEVNWRMQAVGDAEIERRKFGKIVAAGVPVTLFQDGTGKILKTVKGNDPQAILDTITTFKGAR